jgi:hypothetical protein
MTGVSSREVLILIPVLINDVLCGVNTLTCQKRVRFAFCHRNKSLGERVELDCKEDRTTYCLFRRERREEVAVRSVLQSEFFTKHSNTG